MGKRSSVKRVSTISQSASNSIDMKARKRIEELFEITDEIINAYNEINEKYVHQIYRKYKQLQAVNRNLKEKLDHYHCTGCKCTIKTNRNEEEEEEDESSAEEEEDDDNRQKINPALPSSTTNSIITRSKKNNPFIIPDIEETQNFDANDSRFNKNFSDDDEADKISMDIEQNAHKTNATNESSDDSEEEQEQEEEDEEVDDDNGMARLPLVLRNVIQNKVKRKKTKAYLLEIPRYPALCEYLRDRSSTSFDHRPSELQVRPLIENHISKNLVSDAKIRMRLRDELREIHRSYLRTFMIDPHSAGVKSTIQKAKLPVKKSPM